MCKPEVIALVRMRLLDRAAYGVRSSAELFYNVIDLHDQVDRRVWHQPSVSPDIPVDRPWLETAGHLLDAREDT